MFAIFESQSCELLRRSKTSGRQSSQWALPIWVSPWSNASCAQRWGCVDFQKPPASILARHCASSSAALNFELPLTLYDSAMEMHKIDGLGPHRDPSTRVRKSESSLDRLAALKARVAAATNLSKAKRDPRDDGGKANERVAHIKWDGDSESSQSRGPIATKYHRTSVSSNRHVGQAEERKPGINPYYTPTAADHSAGSRQRVPRRLVFNQKGRYIQQANALRRQAALESMKKRIAEQTRKVGINEDLDVEKNFVVDEPPKIEWWDEGLVSGTRYEQMDDPEALKIHTSDTIITELIQHPVALEPPQDRQKPDAKAMFLTSKEQAKIRRQSRRAELKERQAKVRLGLLPPPPSKVKKGNLMLVLGDGTSVSITWLTSC